MTGQEALREIMSAHGVHTKNKAPNGQYPVAAVDALINAMGSLAQMAQQPSGGDTLHINASSAGTKVSLKGTKNSRAFNWELQVVDVARGAEELPQVQARVEKAFDQAFERLSKKYGAPTREEDDASV